MPGDAQHAYLETKILTADPVELVRILYRAAREAARRALDHMAAGRIAERSREISRTMAIVMELSSTLNHSAGTTLSRTLAELYDYMQRKLLEANLRQRPEPLVEVITLLATLLEGWEGICSEPRAEPPIPSSDYRFSPGLLVADAAPERIAQSWSF